MVDDAEVASYLEKWKSFCNKPINSYSEKEMLNRKDFKEKIIYIEQCMILAITLIFDDLSK